MFEIDDVAQDLPIGGNLLDPNEAVVCFVLCLYSLEPPFYYHFNKIYKEWETHDEL